MLQILQKKEKLVFKILEDVYMTVADISNLSYIPRMTTHTILLRLKEMGLVESKKIAGKQKTLWRKASGPKLEVILRNSMRDILSSGKSISVELSTGHSDYSSYEGKTEIVNLLKRTLVTHAKTRFYTFQSNENLKRWIEIIGKKEVNMLNTLVKKYKLIAMALRSLTPVSSVLDQEVRNAYKGRIGAVHYIRDLYVEEDTALYVFNDVVIFALIKDLKALEIRNKKIASLFTKLVSFAYDNTHHGKDFYEG